MHFRNTYLDLSTPKVMGILNVTPDSFSDGGKFTTIEHAIRQVERMVLEGAHFIDVGGESTRPGAKDVELNEEIERVVPVIEAITQRFDVLVSVDTSKAAVMTAAVEAGASLINDVRALQEEGALEAARKAASAYNVPVCLMHMQGQPRTMQHQPDYGDVVQDVAAFLIERAEICLANGIRKEQILLDPGFGFGKTVAHNFALLDGLEGLANSEYPLLIGISRKSMLGKLLDRDVDQRLAASIAAATISLTKGAKIIRVHDVKESVDAVKVFSATINHQGI